MPRNRNPRIFPRVIRKVRRLACPFDSWGTAMRRRWCCRKIAAAQARGGRAISSQFILAQSGGQNSATLGGSGAA